MYLSIFPNLLFLFVFHLSMERSIHWVFNFTTVRWLAGTYENQNPGCGLLGHSEDMLTKYVMILL